MVGLLLSPKSGLVCVLESNIVLQAKPCEMCAFRWLGESEKKVERKVPYFHMTLKRRMAALKEEREEIRVRATLVPVQYIGISTGRANARQCLR
jgi:hypothetical protein